MELERTLDSAAAPARTNYRWKVATLIFLVSFVAYMDRVNLSVATPVIMQEFGFTKIDMGFIQTCAQCDYEPLRELLEVPKKQVIVGTLLVGYPKYKYHALVDRQHLKVEFR